MMRKLAEFKEWFVLVAMSLKGVMLLIAMFIGLFYIMPKSNCVRGSQTEQICSKR